KFIEMTIIQIPPTDKILRQREAAWTSVKDICEQILAPENIRSLKFFQPTTECGLLVHYTTEEYPRK
ncbi:hypothetical protein LOZ58_006912, partial [Ophidiomyces ophidiicola]